MNAETKREKETDCGYKRSDDTKYKRKLNAEVKKKKE